MILAALEQLYHRLAKDDPEGMPRPGWNRRAVSFALVVDADGQVKQVSDLRDKSGKKPFPVQMLVPDHGQARSGSKSYALPYFLCDHTSFLLGANAKTDDKALEYLAHARALHQRLLAACDEPVAKAILAFFARWQPAQAPDICRRDGLDWEKEVSGANLVFRLEDTRGHAHDNPALAKLWEAEFLKRPDSAMGQCLVTGENGPIARLHPGIKLPGTQGNGAPVVSFNAGAFTSYGFDQGLNAPVGEGVAFRYGAALNTLIKPGSHHRLSLGDTVLAFWAEGEATEEEKAVAAMFEGDAPESRLDEALRGRVERVLLAVRRGETPRAVLEDLNPNARFFILGLGAPGGSRVSVRLWLQSTFGDLVAKVAEHQKALDLQKRFDKDPDFPTMRALLRAAVPQGKDELIPGPLAAALAQAVLTGGRYPRSLLAMVLERMRAEHGPYDSVSYLRVALVKAILTRSGQWSPPVSLNTDETDNAYRLGRLFAALERAQQLALGMGVNATIKDRYFGAASASPRAVFPNLIRLAQHHLSKADAGWLDRIIGEIVDALAEFPATLDLEAQGRFALGYYQQRNDFWRKKPTTQQTDPEQ